MTNKDGKDFTHKWYRITNLVKVVEGRSELLHLIFTQSLRVTDDDLF